MAKIIKYPKECGELLSKGMHIYIFFHNQKVINVFDCRLNPKMTKIDIQDQKLIVPNNHQHFSVHFELFLSLFQNSDVK